MAVPPSFEMAPQGTPAFGDHELRMLVGRSAATMVWAAVDRRSGVERYLTLPCEAPARGRDLLHWIDRARHAARLDHPHLARIVEIGVHDRWPFIAVERGAWVPASERLEGAQPSAAESAAWLRDALQGLAYAHEAGIVHGDPQLHDVLVNERGVACLMGLGTADRIGADTAGSRMGGRGMALDPAMLHDRRIASERDVLAFGVLLHHLLTGEPPLGLPDAGRVIERLSPHGRDNLRLPWTTPVPLPEALRAIANRATASQERLRYRAARTFQNALANWLASDVQGSGGPVALLLDRLHTVGHLPALPRLAARVARVVDLEAQRTDEIASQILPDFALSFELLRTLNSATVQGTQIAVNGPVLTLRRVVALIGVNGVRRAAMALRAWPGPLSQEAAALLKRSIDRARLAGHVAQALRPAGYDPEVVFLIAVLQNLGRLMLRYHFADEADQIEQLMRPADAPSGGDAEEPEASGLDEDAAAFAVLGVPVPALGAAVARHWGLGEEVLHMVRRVPADAPVRKPDSDAELLRLVASAANEAVDAVTLLPARRVAAALERIAERYARVLKVTPRILHDALRDARTALKRSQVEAPIAEDESDTKTPAAA
ncbi:MAG TPA: HDOD domain-containing protein [Caldimonas sp.]|nr:HDOD domain-containing protein [Caldimonas sp.]